MNIHIWAEVENYFIRRFSVCVEISVFPVSATKLSAMIVSERVMGNLTLVLFLYLLKSLVLMCHV